MTTFTSPNGGTRAMVMKATFQLQVVWNSIAFYFKWAAPSFQPLALRETVNYHFTCIFLPPFLSVKASVMFPSLLCQESS